jgi:phosphate/sulfate permease
LEKLMALFLLGAIAGYAFAQAEEHYRTVKTHANGWLLIVVLAILLAAV